VLFCFIVSFSYRFEEKTTLNREILKKKKKNVFDEVMSHFFFFFFPATAISKEKEREENPLRACVCSRGPFLSIVGEYLS
jgi:hypothetical protein